MAMSLGWALRGYIGGGPLGAMIPGALVALYLCLLLNRDGDDAAVIAAFGAIGIGFGGQMTYGQTIGLALQPETRWWGLTGLGLKGAIWGLLGGAVLALALVRDRFNFRQIAIGVLAMGLMTQVGWKLINEPKLIYFSNPIDKPRPELWAGLALGAFALLGWLNDRVLWSFARRGALFGGIGFAVGGAIQVVGRGYGPVHPLIGYWKLMELFLGAMLGIAFGSAAWRWRVDLQRRPRVQEVLAGWKHVAIGAAVVLGSFLINEAEARAQYTIAGVPMLLLAAKSPAAAWHLGVTMTYAAFSLDFRRNRPALDQGWLLAGVVVTSFAVAWLVARWRSVPPLFLLLLWTAVVNSLAKSFAPLNPSASTELVPMETLFVLMAIASTVLAPRIMGTKSGS